MRLDTLGKILFFVLLFLPAQQVFSQSPQAAKSPNFLSAKVSIYEFGSRQAQWLAKHPDLATTVTIARSQFPGDEQVSRGYRLTYPTLDIYSSTGRPLYFSDSSEVNLKVIDALPQVIPEPDLNPRYKVRPSLRQALSMIPGIPRRDWATPPQIDYTIFAIFLDPPDANDTPAQKKALQGQKRRAMYGVRGIQAPDPDPEETHKLALANQAANLAQEKAIQRLKTRLNGSRIRVIEIRLEH